MTWKYCEPGGVGSPATALEDSWQGESYEPSRRPQAFCELHHRNIVDDFPALCPHGTANPLTTIGRLQDAAWRELGRGDPGRDSDGALALFDRLDVCNPCLSRLAAHPTVRRLRRELQVTR